MRKFIPILLSLATVATPAFAALQTNGQINSSNEWSMRAPAHFYRKVTLSMGRGTSSTIPQQMIALGQIFGLSAPAASSASVATVVGATLAPNTFNLASSAGRAIHVTLYGRCAANGNNKTVQLIYGGTTIAILNAVASNAKDFYVEADIVCTGNNTQQINVAGYANGALLDNLSTTSATTTSSTVDLKVNVPATTAASDVVINGFSIYGEG